RERDKGHLCFRYQADVPVPAGVPLERGALGLTLYRLGEAQPYAPDLGHLYAPSDHAHPLRDAEPCLVALAALETRIPSTPLEEVDEGTPEVSQHLLQELGVYLS